MDTVPVESRHPRDQQNPRDQQPGRGQQRAETDPARDFGETKVQAWKGPWSVAQKMLERQGLDDQCQRDLTKVLQKDLGVDWKSVREGTELINERNLEAVRKAIEATRNPKLVEWFNKRYPKR